VIPVKDGERYLEQQLAALVAEGISEILVIDSGSTDRSKQIALAAGVEVLEIEPGEFGHGRTRNLGAERTSGQLICFLTQDATPCQGWASAYLQAFSLGLEVGAAFGPHLPRPDTSPMIARELEEFFASFSPDGTPQVQRRGGQSFLSNVNACYARACWQELRFKEVPYAEDQAFGADLLEAGWAKAYHPAAAVLHAHDYGPIEFMRRYFDEYRGLNETSGHVESFGLIATARQTRSAVAADRRWMAARGLGVSEQARWMARGVIHHGSRRAFSAMGSRSQRIPSPLRAALSLERRGDAPAARRSGDGRAGGEGSEAAGAPPRAKPIAQALATEDYEAAAKVWRKGPTPLQQPVPGMAERERLRLALVIPPFSRGSGGHNTLFQILTRLERSGHACSVWLVDHHDHMRDVWPGRIRDEIREYFAPLQGPVYKGFAEWQGADVAIATGWQTVHETLSLPLCRARAYLVNDHEPEFFSTSTERALAQDTYRHGLHCIAASPWLRDLLVQRYHASADAFQLGVDHEDYAPRPVGRRRDTVVYYARHSTPRRAVPIGLMALAELQRRRPQTRIALFGTDKPPLAAFAYQHMGVLSPRQLSWLYSEATVGLCLSLTNFSLMPKEMLACGLPCVELAGVSAESIFGEDGPIELASLSPFSIADSLERLLEDEALWRQRSQAGIELVASHTWEHATDEVEAGLRHALAERELSSSEHRDLAGARAS
jgi:glycosyltransferase involved in cell wall biosynthesis